jgi:pimeloyl-ACP methyl ester carboxylesterase
MGLGGQLTDWSPDFVDMMAEHVRVICFDNRDAGLSSEFDWEPPTLMASARAMLTKRSLRAEYTVDDMSDDAAGLLDALDIDAAHVVGVSMGGMIAQSLAINHPKRVLSLTSVMSNTGDKKHGLISKRVIAKVVRMGEPTQDNAADLGTKIYAHFAGSAWDADEHRVGIGKSIARSWRPKGTARQAAAIASSPDRTKGLGGVFVPTVVIHGMQDTLVKPSGGMATARAVAGSRLVMYPDMGHDIPRTRRREIADEIVRNAMRVVAV